MRGACRKGKVIDLTGFAARLVPAMPPAHVTAHRLAGRPSPRPSPPKRGRGGKLPCANSYTLYDGSAYASGGFVASNSGW
jgi:hypothetical protein